ncbi:tetratricopeptide repeat protein [Pseudogracilibacillus sp. SE30717A]|uniref:tetratricopeptide repeat protein n=1 Tax=Pseudogracilibacillus sp. SE30717A TaxID=3098293 RepID=UPI00300E0197
MVNELVQKALMLRKEGALKKSNVLFSFLVKEFPDDAFLNFQCAWSHDVLGEEANAVPFYEKAIRLGLSEKELEKAIVGLGSTYRTLGEYEKSRTVLLKGTKLFPNNKAIHVFYSMTLYNLGYYSEAMSIVLNCLADTTSNSDILSYRKAINFYSNKLDCIWD